MDRHVLYAVNVDIAGGSGSDILIDQIQDFALDPRVNALLSGGSGGVDPTHVTVMGQDPRMAFSTTAIAKVLAKIGISGLAIAADVDEAGLEAWFQKCAEGGVRASGSVHRKMTVAEGLIVPLNISAAQGDVAALAMEVVCTHDGTNDPIVLATSQALSGSPSVSELFTIGKVVVNGVEIEGVQGIEVAFGIQVRVSGGSGAVWPTHCCIMGRTPAISIHTEDVAVLNTFGLSGAAQGATDSIVCLRKKAEGGLNVADATAEHISFTIDEGMIHCGPISGPHGDLAGAEVVIVPTYDGTNAILVVNTATAIV